ncbi:hypothetical protein [uncultured Ralstonia sp.]|jgi:hypothetical protein|uniref:hypothetical protein n=1 Tax=Ralstonia sp. TaxID=54061 RepID=UPI001EA9842C|nr:hypothetical protein [uncultured Ralstonia sp.]UCF25516.1 MAG: hypothetical protein JSV72_09105 [Ralstonia sp.]
MHPRYLRSLGVSLVLAALLCACGKQDDAIASTTVGIDTALPQACVEAEDAQRACTENQAAGYERVGQPAAAKQLRDALPKEMDAVRARWRSVASKDGLALSCAATRDALRAQPQCRKG